MHVYHTFASAIGFNNRELFSSLASWYRSIIDFMLIKKVHKIMSIV
jgi:hypothetical protein